MSDLAEGFPKAPAEPSNLRDILAAVTDCLVLEMGNLANEDELDDAELVDTLGADYGRQIVAARLRIRQSREALAKAEVVPAENWPGIGEDPMKGPIEQYRGQPVIERLRTAYAVQQKHVPDQTALVWRCDLGYMRMEYLRLIALADSQRKTIRELRQAVSQKPEWYYLGDDTSSENCSDSVMEALDGVDLKPGETEICQISTAGPLPTIWALVHCQTDEEKEAAENDEELVVVEFGNFEEAKAALDAAEAE